MSHVRPIHLIFQRREDGPPIPGWMGYVITDYHQAGGRGQRMAYWCSQARKIFESAPEIEIIEVVTNKSDSVYVGRRGSKHPLPHALTIIPSRSGRWGKTRCEYWPLRDDRRASTLQRLEVAK